MSGFDPGPGWREVQYGADLEGHEHITWDSTGRVGGAERMWVRVPPVPPLPTEPYTVIRVVWTDGDVVDLVFRDGSWHVPGRDRSCGNTEGLRARVRRFEVLAEPRAVTAEAVLEEARAFLDQAWQPGHERVLSYDLQAALFAHIREWAEVGE